MLRRLRLDLSHIGSRARHAAALRARPGHAWFLLAHTFCARVALPVFAIASCCLPPACRLGVGPAATSISMLLAALRARLHAAPPPRTAMLWR